MDAAAGWVDNAVWTAFEQLGRWLNTLSHYRALRTQIQREHRIAGRKLADAAIELPATDPRWTLLALPASAALLLAARKRYYSVPEPSPELARFMQVLATEGARVHGDLSILLPASRRALPTSETQQLKAACDFLLKLTRRGEELGFSADTLGLEQMRKPVPSQPLSAALEPEYALQSIFTVDDDAQLDALNFPAAEFSDFSAVIAQLNALVQELLRRRQSCIDAANALRDELTTAQLDTMPLRALQDVCAHRLRFAPLQAAGLSSVGDVERLGSGLALLPEVGEVSATNFLTAVRAARRDTLAQTPARLSPTQRTAAATALLQALFELNALQRQIPNRAILSFAAAMQSRAYQLSFQSERILILGRRRAASEFLAFVTECRELAARKLVPAIHNPPDPEALWKSFAGDAAGVYAQLAELGVLTSDAELVRGALPDEVVTRTQAATLHQDTLNGTLRSYQEFGAKFILAQERVIIGDEMGLGKTFEALAVAAHLAGEKMNRTLVICPATVVSNWIREIEAKTALRAHRLHGSSRTREAKKWLRSGGVAVTTYDSLGWFMPWFSSQSSYFDATGHPYLDYLIADEAHYVKNPNAQRSMRTEYLLGISRYAALLTGTPMENNLEEFRNLVRYLQPQLALRASQVPKYFRTQVAGIYLRRKVSDVLPELPELVQTDELLPMSRRDEEIYADAVTDSNFMAMRQAALLDPSSTKLERIAELVEQARANGRRVLIYSYFLNVLALLERELPGSFGPITGATAAATRQKIVDEFSAAPAATDDASHVLLAQITSGGVGLNIQAANVVIICEPQLKPTTEWQAIARAHRMGQIEPVQVYRLISETGVDARLTQLLHTKTVRFSEFANDSATAQAVLSAQDVEQIVQTERARLFSA